MVRTHIGYGSPHKQDTFEAHGAPLGEEEVKADETEAGLAARPPLLSFLIRPSTIFGKHLEQGRKAEDEWNSRFSAYCQAFPDLGKRTPRDHEGRIARRLGCRCPPLSP